MNETTLDYLYRISMITLFITALSIFFIMYGHSNDLIELLKNNIVNDNTVYESNFDVEEYTVTGTEIIGDISLGLTTDIIVQNYLGNNTFISKNTSPQDFNSNYSSVIYPSSKYKVSRIIDGNGKVITMVYIEK